MKLRVSELSAISRSLNDVSRLPAIWHLRGGPPAAGPLVGLSCELEKPAVALVGKYRLR